MRKTLLILFAIILCGMAGIGVTAYSLYFRPGPYGEAKNVVIPSGGIKKTLLSLQGEGLIHKGFFSASLFKIAALLTRQEGKIHAAELAFPAHASIQQILSILRFGKPVRHELTIPEGLTHQQISHIINGAPFLEGQIELKEEAEILPQTYAYIWGMSRMQLVQKMRIAQKNMVQKIWENREKSIPLSTPGQLVILASIVEKETALPAERAMIARVFLNRLQMGMKLQSDPTVIYGLSNGNSLGRPLKHDDLLVETPYNTYVITGLPPHPICAPGAASLQAVAHPASGPWLYFVGDGNGKHNFSTTLKEHNHNVSLLKATKQHLLK
ncbi:endolytic transglycosylase MltG [Entomobacter blattae]|uniref:Endolytic murein transglycosylase n=1 Tax=Entomobacter blattae TaxID=2762277 RepID=A0A7H1NPB3_9PROT|nr:endolytic transglycosylase MltG [Entomobacter blattae]QNT77623.1 YceG-like family protein [Entomobacter blattae]